MKKTNVERMLELIQAKPEIRSVEIESELGIENCTTQLRRYVETGFLLTDKVQAPSGRMVHTYRVNPQFETLQQATNKKTRSVGIVTAALYTNGDLVIEKGTRTIRLNPDETRDLVTYLDRINVEQILSEARAE